MGHLNAVLAASNTEDQTFFFGVGDHGGGIYEKQLNWLLELEDQYELVFSTLEDYFAIMAKEDLPILEGEHVHHAPGCYSANSAIKHWMSDTEKNFYKAEKITLQGNWHDRQKNIAALNNAWGEFLFNYFHDIYPGTSIRSAYEHEIRDINGYANHQATTILEQGLSRIGATINTDFLTEGGVMLWNSLSVPVMGKGSYDTFSDPNYSGSRFNCLIDGEGNRIPLQWINAESGLNIFNCWGKAVFTSPMKASQAKAFAFGRTDEFDAEKVGYDRQKKLLERIRFQVLDDLGDTWAHGVKELGPTLGDARLVDVKELDNGPVVSLIHAFYEWKNSKFELKLYAWKDIEEIEAEFIADWQERKETLKICLETGVADAPVLSGQMASSIRRKPDICEQPFIDFVSVDGNGFMAEYFHSYDSIGSGELRLTLIRPIVYT